MIEYTKRFTDTERISYAIKFLSKDPSRFVLQHLHVTEDGQTMVATDGRVMTTVTLQCGMEPGLYKVLKSTKSLIWLDKLPEDAGVYPRWQAVMPAEDQFERKFTVRRRRELCYVAALFGCYIDFDETMKMEVTGIAHIKDGDNPVLVVGGWHRTVIMPVRNDMDAVVLAERDVEKYWREKIAKEMEGKSDTE